VRTAWGAPRGRIARQLLTESALLAALGAAAGLALAASAGAAARASLFPDVDWSVPALGGRVLLFALAATTLTALLTGLAPVAHVRASGVQAGLRSGAREGGGRRARGRTALLLAQAALSVVLLVGAGLFVRSLLRVGALDFGYDRARLLVVDAAFPDGVPAPERRAALERMLDRATRLPGVAGAGLSSTSPFWSFGMGDVSVPGVDSAAAALREGPVISNVVTPGLLAAVGTRVARGRAITAGDVAGAPRVALVNEAMARRVWRGADPIGRCVKIGGDTMPCSEVVGVVHNTLLRELRETPVMQYYVPLAQHPGAGGGNLLVRAADADDPRALVPTLRREMAAVAPAARYVDVLPLADRIAPQMRPWRLGASAFGALGALALLIASVGLYSVMAYAVAQRSHEMGLRMALGARGRDVLAIVLRQGLGVAAAGIALGVAAALVAGRWIAPLLFDVSPRDPVVLGGVAATLLAAALAATLLPARRATRANPTDALRAE
jgi:putative ABC transport system permease protein